MRKSIVNGTGLPTKDQAKKFEGRMLGQAAQRNSSTGGFGINGPITNSKTPSGKDQPAVEKKKTIRMLKAQRSNVIDEGEYGDEEEEEELDEDQQIPEGAVPIGQAGVKYDEEGNVLEPDSQDDSQADAHEIFVQGGYPMPSMQIKTVEYNKEGQTQP
jgi:hypothetical protein